MRADQQWKMRATRDEKKMIRRVAKRFHLTQSAAVKFLIQTADKITADRTAAMKPKEQATA